MGDKMKYKNETEAVVSRLNAVATELRLINRRIEELKSICHGWKCENTQESIQTAERNTMLATSLAYETLAAITNEIAKEIPDELESEKEPF